MCGIFGIVSLQGDLEIRRDAFTAATDLQTHRGPDNSGVLFDRRFAFGHRRLSIIDLSADGNQPMVSHDNQVVVTFNGEIFNFREIRESLRKKGHTFRTSSDTEVLLHAYLEDGPSCVHSFIGMFAFAIFDRRTQEAFIFRDRLGVKPLYYAKEPNALIFSSEIKSILHYDHRTRELNAAAVSSYLSYRYPILNDSFFRGIESLPPGFYLRIRDSRVSLHQYWDPRPAFSEQENDRGEVYYIDRLRDILASSVGYRMISDVPSGAFLSGGVDSSVLTALMAQLAPQRIKTFTIGFSDPGYSEFEYARLMAERYNTDHKEISLSDTDYVSTMVKLIDFKDAPLSVPNEVPLYLMSKALKQDITVVLSGEGADELFAGYGRIFRSCDDFAKMQPEALSSLSATDREEITRRFFAKYDTAGFDREVSHFRSTYSYTSTHEKRALLHADANVNMHEEIFEGRFQSLFDEVSDRGYFNKLTWAFSRVHLVGLLHRVDTTTMAASVEARVPFLDHRLVEFAYSIPQHYKLRWNDDNSRVRSRLLMSDEISERFDTPKYILKKAYENDVPREILYRKKMGFPVPLNQWMTREFFSFSADILLSQQSRERGLLNMPTIEQWLTEAASSSNHKRAQTIWMLVNLELFNQRYFDVNRSH